VFVGRCFISHVQVFYGTRQGVTGRRSLDERVRVVNSGRRCPAQFAEPAAINQTTERDRASMSSSTPAASGQPNGSGSDIESFTRAMIVVAHPDDAEFSSAGTLAKFAKEGKHVVLVLCTSGDKGTARRDISSPELAALREGEQLEASKRLGLAETVFLRLGDGELVPDLAFREKIVRQIRAHRPDILITHDPFRPYALHPDHRAVGITAVDSVYPTARDPLYFPEHLQDGLEPHKVAELWLYGSEAPDTFIDISETFDTKIHALKAHQSQVGTAETLEQRMRDRAEELGRQHGLPMAEAFKVVKMRR
jgi:LmbE family N-acetylglucosaminyl deacetylase